jgi:hypothetical protein
MTRRIPGVSEKLWKYRVAWDNGASACGTFPHRFDTYEEAEAFGRDWAFEANVRDFGTENPDEGYTFDVHDVDEPETFTDDEKDAHEGADHMRARKEVR